MCVNLKTLRKYRFKADESYTRVWKIFPIVEKPKLNFTYLEKYKMCKSEKSHDEPQVFLDEFGIGKIRIWGA